MRKLAIRLVAALSSFVIGIFIVAIWSVNYPQETIVMAPAVLQAVNQEVRPLTDELWREVTVEGLFSFYVPQYLRDDGHWLSGRQAVGCFRRANFDTEGLYHLYYDSYEVRACNRDTPSNYKATRSEVLINGKRARIITMIPNEYQMLSIGDVPKIQVCFPDIGHGQKLYMSFASGSTAGLEVAKQVINTIEFQ